MAMARRMTARRMGMAAAGVVVAVVALAAGCGAGGGDDATGESADMAPADDGAARDGAAPEAAAGGAEPAPEEPAGAGAELVDLRAIIYTGNITVRVDDVDQSAEAAGDLADRYGGFVSGDRRTVDEDFSTADLVLRIPSESFAAAVDGLGDLGEEESREVDTEDVTAEVVDLETRIATAEVSLARTRELMEQANSIDDIIRIEGELATRETELARLQARQRALDDLTTLSTITVHLLGPEAEQEESEPETGFLAGLSSGWDAFTGSLRVLVTALGALLPFLIALGAPAAAAVWWARRRRARQPAAPTAPL